MTHAENGFTIPQLDTLRDEGQVKGPTLVDPKLLKLVSGGAPRGG